MRYAPLVHRAWPWLLSMCLLGCAGEASSELEPDASSWSDVVEMADAEVTPADQSSDDDGVPDAEESPDAAELTPDTGSSGPDDAAEPEEDTAVDDVLELDVTVDTSGDVEAGDVAAEDALSGLEQGVPVGASPGRAPMRRLTRSEVDLTLRDLTGVTGVAAKTLPPMRLQ